MLARHAIDDTRLSLKALAIHTYLMSKPDTWNVNVKQLAKRFDCGATMVRTALRELREYGYVENVIEQSKETGRITGRHVLVHEESSVIQETRNTGNPNYGKVTDIVSNVVVVSNVKVESNVNDCDVPSQTPEKPNSEHKEMFGIIQNITAADAKLQASRIGKCARELIDAGYTVEMMKRFGTDVWARDWRWEKNRQRPTFDDITKNVGKLKQGRSPDLTQGDTTYTIVDRVTGKERATS